MPSNHPDSAFTADLAIQKPSVRINARDPSWAVDFQSPPRFQNHQLPSPGSRLDLENCRILNLAERQADKAMNIEVNKIQRQTALQRRERALHAKQKKGSITKEAMILKEISCTKDGLALAKRGDKMASLKATMDVIQKEILSKKKRSITLIYVDLRNISPCVHQELICPCDEILSQEFPSNFLTKFNENGCSLPVVDEKQTFYGNSSPIKHLSNDEDDDEEIDSVYSLSSSEGDGDDDSIDEKLDRDDEIYVEKPVLSPKLKRKLSPSKSKTKVSEDIDKIFEGCNFVSSSSSPATDPGDSERRRQLVVDFFEGKKSSF